MNSSMSGCQSFSVFHLGGTPGFAAALHHVGDPDRKLSGTKVARLVCRRRLISRAWLRKVERSLPVPLPYLNSIASLVASRMMSSMVSSTDWMKQALPCGYSY